jgi:hypothetical protein
MPAFLDCSLTLTSRLNAGCENAVIARVASDVREHHTELEPQWQALWSHFPLGRTVVGPGALA